MTSILSYDRRGSRSYLRKRLLLAWLIKRVSTNSLSFLNFLELRGLSNFFHKPYSSIDAMKLSKLSTRTTPASWPLSASFIAAKVSAFGTSSKAALLETGESETILTPLIRERTFFNCSNKDGLSTCNVNCGITSIFVSTPLSPSCEEGVLNPLPSPRPFQKGKGCNRPTRCSEPLRYKVDGASKPSPNCAGWDRFAITYYNILLR